MGRLVDGCGKFKLYVVTKSSSDNSVAKGDLIWLSDNGDLNSVQGKGWLNQEEWQIDDTNDF